MTEQMIINAARIFKKKVKDALYERDMKLKDLAKILNVTEAALSLAVNAYALNPKSRETREKIRKLFNITDL